LCLPIIQVLNPFKVRIELSSENALRWNWMT
jgi:hypothetical protein